MGSAADGLTESCSTLLTLSNTEHNFPPSITRFEKPHFHTMSSSSIIRILDWSIFTAHTTFFAATLGLVQAVSVILGPAQGM